MKEGHTSAIYVEGIQKCTFYKILHKTVEKILLNALSVSIVLSSGALTIMVAGLILYCLIKRSCGAV